METMGKNRETERDSSEPWVADTEQGKWPVQAGSPELQSHPLHCSRIKRRGQMKSRRRRSTDSIGQEDTMQYPGAALERSHETLRATVTLKALPALGSWPISVPLCVTSHRGCYLQLFEIRALFGHHGGQELVLESVPGDQEVDEGALGLHLRLVVWVEVLGVQDQAELGVILHLLVPDLDVPGWWWRQG